MKEYLDWVISFFRWLTPAPALDNEGGPGDSLLTRLHLWWAYRPL